MKQARSGVSCDRSVSSEVEVQNINIVLLLMAIGFFAYATESQQCSGHYHDCRGVLDLRGGRRISRGGDRFAGTDIEPVASEGDIQVYTVSIPELTRIDRYGMNSIDAAGAVSLPIKCELDCASGTVTMYACEPDGTAHEIASSLPLEPNDGEIDLGLAIDGLMAFGKHYTTDLIAGVGESRAGNQHGFFLSSFVIGSDGTVAFTLGFKRYGSQGNPDFEITGHVDLVAVCKNSGLDWLKAVSFDDYDNQPVTWSELQSMVSVFKEASSYEGQLPIIGSEKLETIIAGNGLSFTNCKFYLGRYFTMEIHLKSGKQIPFTISADMQDQYHVVQLVVPGQEPETWPVVGNVALLTQALLAGWCNPESGAPSTNYIDPASWATTYDADNHLVYFSTDRGTGPDDNLGTVTGFLDLATGIVSITGYPGSDTGSIPGFPVIDEKNPSVQVGSLLAFLELYNRQGHVVYQGSGDASELENGVVVSYFILQVTSNGKPADIYINLQTGLVGVGGPGRYFSITRALSCAGFSYI